MDEALSRLAQRCGILPGYHDIFGRYHAADAEGVIALLQALGVLSGPQDDPAAALEAWERRRWRRAVPAVRVLRQGEAVSLRVVVAEERGALSLGWEIEEEGGRQEGGEPAQVRELERRDGQVALELVLPVQPALGYHRLRLTHGNQALGECSLIICPDTVYQPPALEGEGRVWGPAVQLYAVRSERNWGMGDFTDLGRLARLWAGQGADLVGLNPLHALFLGNPPHASPYSPSSRRFLNPLYLDVEAVADFAECEPAREEVRSAEFQLRLQALRDQPLVDYAGVAALKRPMLELLYRHFRQHHLADGASARAQAFRRFQHEQGAALRHYALYETLWEHCHARDPDAWGWRQWPPEYRDPASEAVAACQREQLERIEFFEYLQWQAELQLAQAARSAAAAGMELGLYLDLAVSVDRGGADGWSDQGLYAQGVSVGAPPDDFNPLGQDWGLPPFIPFALEDAGYGPFIDLLRENMRRAGAIRVDHVMGLMRLYWVPAGRGAAQGAYVLYPFEDQLGILALESHRNRCMVIGEDLGTVPEEVRAAMARTGMLSYRVLFFEKDHQGQVKPPQAYPAQALATVSTHDLPTLAGFWEGHDVALRHAFGLFDSDEERARQLLGRVEDRARLLLALEREGLLPEGLSADPASAPAMTEALARALHVYLARSPSKLMMVQPEDVLGSVEQVNLPGSPEDKHPNWRRKHGLPLERWDGHEPFLRLGEALRATRQPSRRRRRRSPGPVIIPRATYRLQLQRDFGFRDAAAIVPYLAALGVSHVYCSPYLMARPGSRHGYDIIDHNALNPELGGEAGYQAFVAALEAEGLGQILDLVPNHMGVMGRDNRWWQDVLEHGPASPHAPCFDIDWTPLKPELRGKVLLPVLGRGYGDTLEAGELKLVFEPEAGAFAVCYFEHRFPIAPETYPRLLEPRLEALALRLGGQDPALPQLESLVGAFAKLPPRDETEPQRVLERSRDAGLHKQRLAALARQSAGIGAWLEDLVQAVNGRVGDPDSFDELHGLLEAQAYRLADWHAAADEINYRRFFDIHDLAALRMEDPRVFEATHQRVLGLVEQGLVQGLRVDHPDGLHDPLGYFQRLQARAGGEGEAPGIYLLAEKILAVGEALPAEWPVHGTTGYDFLNLVNGLLVDGRAQRRLTRFYRAFSGETLEFEELVYKCKQLIMKYALASELNVLANALNRISEADRHSRDFTLNRLRHALAGFVAWLEVYRTYGRDGQLSGQDRACILRALARARERSLAEEVGVFEFLRSILLGEGMGEAPAARRFLMGLQQYTGPVMAKGFEDTALYRYFPLASLNEVGGDPRRFAVDLPQFHAAMEARARHWPHALSATATHDNKRGEEVRARIDVLSELDRDWRRAAREWAALAAPLKREVNGRAAPSRNDEYLLYQTLIGAWPLEGLDGAERAEFLARIQAYMLKATREAKRHTSWLNPNPAYEAAMADFVAALLAPGQDNRFLASFLPLQRRVARLGLFNSLSQTLLKLTAPGVPDIYQGCELWDFSLVDPDNRRPVDYSRRRALLDQVAQGPGELEAALVSGAAKLWLIRQALTARRQHETLFRDGGYRPLATSGARVEHLCAFARLGQGQALVVAPRLYAGLLGEGERLPLGEAVWGDTRIELRNLSAAARYINVLGGGVLHPTTEAGGPVLRVAQVLAGFPVALLLGEG